MSTLLLPEPTHSGGHVAFQDAVPKWHDPAGILAMLRVCNYNPDECIGTYLHLKGDGELSSLIGCIPMCIELFT